MAEKKKILAVVPARAGSKSLPRKNIYPLNGKPLIHYTIEAALDIGFFDRVVLTTDSGDIKGKCSRFLSNRKFCIRMRPKELADDDTPLAPVIIDALKNTESVYQENYDLIFTLQPTSPLRTEKDIVNAMQFFRKRNADSLLSVVEERHSLWGIDNGEVIELYKPRVNRQNAVPYYLGNGAIFITKRDILITEGDRAGGKIAVYAMDKTHSLDIHDINDIKLAEYYLKSGAA